MKRFVPCVLALGLVFAFAGCQRGKPAKESITIWWAQWAPADGPQELGREFEKETGIKVVVHQIPWSDFEKEVFIDFGNPETGFDIVAGRLAIVKTIAGSRTARDVRRKIEKTARHFQWLRLWEHEP